MYGLISYLLQSYSFNDDAYLTTMGVGSHSSHWSQTNEIHENDHEYENMDEDGEGFVDVPKGRVDNYIVQEDILLCNAWLNVSLNASDAMAQTFNTYWDRMKVYFDTCNKSGIECSNRSVRSRWSLINNNCKKWSAAMSAVDSLNPSGRNDINRVSGISLFQNFISLFYFVFYNLFSSMCSSILHKTCFV